MDIGVAGGGVVCRAGDYQEAGLIIRELCGGWTVAPTRMLTRQPTFASAACRWTAATSPAISGWSRPARSFSSKSSRSRAPSFEFSAADDAIGIDHCEQADATARCKGAEGPGGGADVLCGYETEREDDFLEKCSCIAFRIADYENGGRALGEEAIEIRAYAGCSQLFKVFAERGGNYDETATGIVAIGEDLPMGLAGGKGVRSYEIGLEMLGDPAGELVLVRSVFGEKDMIQRDLRVG